MLNDLMMTILPVISLIISICLAIGGVVAFRSGYGQRTSEEQEKTISALQVQIEILEKQNVQQQQRLDHQEFELQAMRDALKDEGIFITIDGEKITIKDMREPNVTRHVVKRPTHKTTAIIKKTQEEGT